MVSTTYRNEKFEKIFESSKREYLNEIDRHYKLLFEAGGFCFLNILAWMSFIILGSTSKISQVFNISSFCFLPITSKIYRNYTTNFRARFRDSFFLFHKSFLSG